MPVFACILYSILPERHDIHFAAQTVPWLSADLNCDHATMLSLWFLEFA